MTDPVQRALDRLVAAGVPGAIAYSRFGSRASGIGDRRSGALAHIGDRFRIGSNTKPFVAAVVLQLVAEGRLALDDPVAVAPVPDVTVRHLLQHTSGLPEYSDDPRLLAPYVADPDHHWEPRDLLALVAGQETSAPGVKFAYANTNYVLLGLVIEAVTGNTAPDEVRRRLIEPLRLTGTTFPVCGAAIPGRHLRGHLTNLPASYGVPDGILDFTDLSPSIGWTAGGMVSTVADLARFHRALLTGRVLGPEPGRAMIAEAEPHGYGLGLARIVRPGIAGWGHDGRFPGYLSIVVTSDDGRQQAVAVLNTDRVLSPEAEAATGEVLRAAFNAGS
ncbi:serine hydrolase domain-containing protein [Micromonospora chalcea]|uniref:serine hydrolase domain-containing protein n=1 Tax=Micromonospora chalcea TaxID=1874 RepID=UPI0037FCB6CC